MPSIGPTEIIIVLVIALVALGPKRLPDAGRAIGRSIREFKDGISDRASLDAGPETAAEPGATTLATEKA